MADINSTTHDGVLTLSFSNPERRNAMTLEMWRKLPVLLAQAAADAMVRVIVLTGAASNGFVSGADISEFDAYLASETGREEFSQATRDAIGAVRAFPKPVIAKINGDCIGGGMALALCCDIRYAVDSAAFGIPAARLGLGYGLAGVQDLVAVTGEAVAAEVLFTGRRFTADEALRFGMVQHVVAPEALDEAVAAVARRIASNAPLTVAAAKMALRAARTGNGIDDVQRAVRHCFDSDDFREGVRAFREKRTPKFVGR